MPLSFREWGLAEGELNGSLKRGAIAPRNVDRHYAGALSGTGVEWLRLAKRKAMKF